MFERFTERARQVVVLAQDEARTLKHNYIGTEHILLGLLSEEEGLAARVLDTLDITVEEVRAQVARVVGQGDEVTFGQIPFTPRVKKVLELALREALDLGHEYIGTEHILLGLVQVEEGVAARVLLEFDADAGKIRNELTRLLSGLGDPHPSTRPQLVVACPGCAYPLETIPADPRNTRFAVSLEGDRTCPRCGRRWTISSAVSWRERPD
jgi:ATP-dependent Clp protease ATP-binding subunit ClpC